MTNPLPVPDPADPAPMPLNPGIFLDTIERINQQIQGEQPGSASAMGWQWRTFARMMENTATRLRGVNESFADWESPEARDAYLLRSGYSLIQVERAQEAAQSIGDALVGLSIVMREGQERMQTLYDDYVSTMAAWDAAAVAELENMTAPHGIFGEIGHRVPIVSIHMERATYPIERDSTVGAANGRNEVPNRSDFVERWNQRAREVAMEISDTYIPYVSQIGNASVPSITPQDAVYHPSAFGQQIPDISFGGGGAPLPPGAGPAVGAPPAVQLTAPPAPPLAPPAPVAPPAPTPAVTPPPAPAPPVAPVVPLPPGAAPGVPPGVAPTPPGFGGTPPVAPTAPGGAPVPPGGVPVPPGGVLVPPGVGGGLLPPGGLIRPPGAVTNPPGTPPGTLVPSAGVPPGAPSFDPSNPLPPGVAPTTPPGVSVTNPGVPPGAVLTPRGPAGGAPPGAGMAMPPGMGAGMPPGMGGAGPNRAGPRVPGAQRRGQGSGPPGGVGNPAGLPPGADSGWQAPPGSGMGMPPGMGAPPGSPHRAPPGGAPPGSRRSGSDPATPDAGAPGLAVPEAFLPPSPGSPPVLGQPQRRQGRPGGQAEAPRPPGTGQGAGPGIGGGIPPVLVNRHRTGPRMTYTQQREADRQARRDRVKRFQELLKSTLAKAVPEGTAPVLDGRAAVGPAAERVVEVPPALAGAGAAGASAGAATTRPGRRTPPADRTSRRLVDEQRPANPEPAANPDVWEVENPGGPVVAGDPPVRRRDRAPRALGGA